MLGKQWRVSNRIGGQPKKDDSMDTKAVRFKRQWGLSFPYYVLLRTRMCDPARDQEIFLQCDEVTQNKDL